MSVFSISEKDDSAPIVKGESTTQVKSTRWNHTAWVQNQLCKLLYFFVLQFPQL